MRVESPYWSYFTVFAQLPGSAQHEHIIFCSYVSIYWTRFVNTLYKAVQAHCKAMASQTFFCHVPITTQFLINHWY